MALTIFGQPIVTGLGPKAQEKRRKQQLKVAKATGQRPSTFLESAESIVSDIWGPEPEPQPKPQPEPVTETSEPGSDPTTTIFLAVVSVGAIAAIYQLSDR